MKLRRALALAPCSGVLLFVAMTAHAKIIEYTASGVIEQVDNSASLLPNTLSAAQAGQAFAFDFAVDTTTPGSGSADDMVYDSAVQSASFAFAGASQSFGFAVNAVEILNNSGGLTGFVVSGGDPVAANFTGIAGSAALLTLAYSNGPSHLYANAALSNAPLKTSRANLESDVTISFTSYVGGAYQAMSDLIVGPLSIKTSAGGGGGGSMTAPEIDPASASSALTLLAGCLLVLRSRRHASRAATLNA